MRVIKLLMILALAGIVYMTGYNAGSNDGIAETLKYNPNCNQPVGTCLYAQPNNN